MQDTLEFHMRGGLTPDKQSQVDSQRAFCHTQNIKKLTEAIASAYPNGKISQHAMFGKENYLSDIEKNYIDFLICDGETEFEIRQIDSEIQLGLDDRAPEIISHIIERDDGKTVETIAQMTICPETFSMKISSYCIESFAEKQDMYNAIEEYIRFRMKQLGYKYVLKTSSFPGTLRFGKAPFEYTEPTKIELVSTVESDALLGIVR